MNPRIKATARFLKQLRHLLNNWDYFTKDNHGFYSGKIRFYDHSGVHFWTKSDIIELIKKNKEYIRKELNK